MQHFYMLKIVLANQSFNVKKWKTGGENTAKLDFNKKILYLNSVSKWINAVWEQ